MAASLPGSVGLAVLDVSRGAFVEAMQVAATISAVVAVAVALIALTMLRRVPTNTSDAAEEARPITETDCFGRTRGCVPAAISEA